MGWINSGCRGAVYILEPDPSYDHAEIGNGGSVTQNAQSVEAQSSDSRAKLTIRSVLVVRSEEALAAAASTWRLIMKLAIP